jgi:ADP-ribose pyrophosphatase YjhB (NUDIX family)
MDILNKLLFAARAKYSELKEDGSMENSQFVFHLHKLIDNGYVIKKSSHYELTTLGKEYANRMAYETAKIPPRCKASTIMVPYRDTKEGREYLIYKRLKNPFYGCEGFATEKPEWGETFEDAAKRGLKEEANITGNPKLFAIRHFLVSTDGENIIEDKLMHAFMFENPQGELKSNPEGHFFWIKESEIEEKVTYPLEEFWEILEALKNFDGKFTFKEEFVETDKF